MESMQRPPRQVAVVGAGMVGLSTAWFLQEHGVDVTVYDAARVGSGASWGNAGWLTPALVAPLPEPAVLRYGVRAVLSPSSPVYVPVSADAGLLRFLTGFVRHSTNRHWRHGIRAFAPMSRGALAAYDSLLEGGVASPVRDGTTFLAAYRSGASAAGLLHELDEVRASGVSVEYDVVTGAEARRLAPALSDRVGAAVRVHGQRFIDPPGFVSALAAAVRERGGTIREGSRVVGVRDHGSATTLDVDDGSAPRHDCVVIATGARFDGLVRPFGVRRIVQAGRGYSFTVPVADLPRSPVYLPEQRVACTPLGDRLRIAGMMEFRRPDVPLDPRRIAAIVDAARPMLGPGADLDDRHDEWVGSRPCTADGLPLIGPTGSRRVLAAGGLGMWGIVLGPLTGRLVADTIATGTTPPELTPFDPLR